MINLFPQQIALLEVLLLPLVVGLRGEFLLPLQALFDCQVFQLVLPAGVDFRSLEAMHLAVATVSDDGREARVEGVGEMSFGHLVHLLLAKDDVRFRLASQSTQLLFRDPVSPLL